MIKHSKNNVKLDVYKACFKNIAKVDPFVKRNLRLVFEKFSRGSVLVVLSHIGGTISYIVQCPLQLCQVYYNLKKNG